MMQITDLGLRMLPLAELQLPEGNLVAWAVVAAAILAPLFTIILLFVDRRSISRKLTVLDEAVRRTASAQKRSMDDAEPWESTRERVVLGNMGKTNQNSCFLQESCKQSKNDGFKF